MNNKPLTLGIFAPANPMAYINPALIELGIKHLNALGIQLKFASNVDAKHGHTAGTIEERVADLHELLLDDDVTMLMAVYGGFNSNQLLEYINYDLIKEKAKPIIGYSDITALLNAIYIKTGVKTFHGPAFISFCNPTVFPEFIETMFAVIRHEADVQLKAPTRWASDDWFLKENFQPRDVYPHNGWTSIKEGAAQGVLLGGNLETLLALAGTPYLPDFTDKILLLESVEDNPAKFDRDITQLKLMGVLGKIKGLIIGQFPKSSALSDSNILREIIDLHTKDQSYPILADTNFSHVDPLYTLPIGGEVSINASPKPSVTIKIGSFTNSFMGC